MSEIPIQTYEPGHAGMYTISSGNGTYVKRADHLKELEGLREQLRERQEQVERYDRAIAQVQERLQDEELAFSHANEVVGKLEADLEELRAQLRPKDEQLAGMRDALQAEKDREVKILPRLVVCALIVRNGKILLERRAPSGVAGLDNMWDLPGGKVEPGETPEQAVIREIDEELSIRIRASRLLPYLPVSTWKYPDGEQRHWILAAYACEILEGEPTCTDSLQWFDVNALENVEMLEADRRLIALSGPSPALNTVAEKICDEMIDNLRHNVSIQHPECAHRWVERIDEETGKGYKSCEECPAIEGGPSPAQEEN